ncbi:serrate RNA effector molecule homolog [Glandiceps talaboti]
MGDSDEEYDRRRGRDKFRRERSDYDRRDREDRSRRDDWGERRRESRDTGRHDWSRRDYSDYDRRGRDRYSPQRRDMSPSVKRMRRDWDDSGYAGYDASMSYAGGHQYGPPPGWGHPSDVSHQHMQQAPLQHAQGQRHSDMDHGMGNQPQMMTFKQFLASQDDSIDDQEAVRKYNEYKIEFKRQQLSDFFLAHKDEEWFRSKYHPDECGKRKEESLKALKNRRDVFLDLFNKGWLDTFSVDIDKQDDIVKYLDAAVIKMEGGSNHDLKILDQPQSPVKTTSSPFRRSRSESESQPDKTPDDKSTSQKRNTKEAEETERRGKDKIETDESEDVKNGQEKKKDDDKSEQNMTPEQQKLAKMAEEYKKQQEDEDDKTEKKEEKPARKKHEYNYDENDSGSGSDSDDSEPEPAPPGVEPPPPPGTENSGGDKPKETNGDDIDKPKEANKEDKEEEEKAEPKESKESESTSKDEEVGEKEKNDEEEKEKDTKETVPEEKEIKTEPEEPLPRPLHKTYSLFMRNLAPLITKAEIAALCKRYPGFLRVALADPQPERRFYRRGWITFDRSVNIKEICWNLNNIRLRDCELAPVVNRDLTRRVRPVSGITSHRTIVKSDIKTAAKLVQMLDDKHGLWNHDDEEKTDPQKESFLMSKNPVLENITDYLVDEASAEEDELLGTSSDAKDEQKDNSSDVQLERDDKLMKALDRLVMYLRIVHSVDYYNSVDYPNEDEMPNRCGIMHARGPPPSVNKITQNELTDWQNTFNQKINPLLLTPQAVSEEDLVKFGKKDADVEQEKFITANTQEVAKDKWLCPLSGKKFRGPEFVRKHIINKHGDKLEDVKKEVSFFNTYLADPKRPQLPEPPTPKTPSQQSGGGGREGYNTGQHVGYQGPPQQGSMGYSQPRQPVGYGGTGGFGTPNYGNRNTYDQYTRGAQTFPPKPRARGGPRSDPREIVQYRDLDAPEDMDYF